MIIATGILYVIIGSAGAFLNLFIATAIAADKSLQNHTYRFMRQLALSDMEAIMGIALLPGLMLLADTGSSTGVLGGLACFMAASGYQMSMYCTILTAFSRWSTIARKSGINKFLTGRGRVVLSLCLWIGVHCSFSPYVLRTDTFVYVRESMSCRYQNTSLSQLIAVYSEYTNYASVLLTLLFNAMTLFALSQMRNQVVTPEMKQKNKQEVKLYIQCAIDNFFFLSVVLFVYTTIHLQIFTPWVMVLLTAIVIFHHFDCALLYICFNKKVRSGVLENIKLMFSATPVAPVHQVSTRAGRSINHTVSRSRN